MFDAMDHLLRCYGLILQPSLDGVTKFIATICCKPRNHLRQQAESLESPPSSVLLSILFVSEDLPIEKQWHFKTVAEVLHAWDKSQSHSTPEAYIVPGGDASTGAE
eukprot:CAMPEP_0178452366 /NCGR_PEP_ID=MMETSP0689_2-20121128/44206_1 /TAXON_ID=160604 /ORGANISM="Amphidinium massartii, Strain CS-259" /LENGTH=105 /DNA_ID=CAMNT_0020078067 /DNA_START=44 /DNA_END=361 /DNA_ORIENTATION=-